ncbi:MAG: insulinase family protein, partial [candidate division Zixibacteria bacterium]|nr:insulinase family protein [candidate division Zixibacteria bacterium]
MTRSYTKGLAVTLLLALLSLPVMADTDLATLTENQRIADFSTECLYQNELGKVMGARFRHVPSGFVLDLLRIQSVPQSFIWVNTHPATDQGTPHTLEHLLLGKGTKGRWVASYEDMSLGRSSAFTERLRTCYHFHTTAGGDIFFDLFEKKLDAMLHPNYTDEEIRREVCNIGVAMDPTDSTLRLEEKGTVYTEMISSFERPWGDLWYQLGKTLYGPNHPDGNSSGGLPAAIRTLTPQDIRNFHDSTHHLNNMGAQVSIADDISIDECLAKLSGIFARVEPDATPAAHPEDAILAVPEPAGAEPGTMVHVSFPHQNPDEPGLMVFAWPAKIELDPQESYLLDFMLDNIASGQTSNLYQKFIASQTRVMDIGATSVFYWRSDHRGNPIFLGLSNVKREAASDKMMDSVRTLILDEFRTLASLADGSDELKVFNERALSRVIEGRRGLRDFLSSPPRWGYRGTGSAWMEHLQLLHRKGGFRRDLALVDELNFAEEQLKQDKNIWRDLIAKWKLLEYTPYALVTLPEPEYLARIGTETEARLATELEDLTLRYGTDATQAIEKFASEYELATASIDSAAASIEMPGFINDPPMTIDDQLKYTVDKVGGGEFVASHFDNMTGATFG